MKWMNELLKNAISFVEQSLNGPWNIKKIILILTIFALPMGPFALIVYFGIKTFGGKEK